MTPSDVSAKGWQFAPNEDGTLVPLCAFEAPHASRAALLLLPALGVEARFYRRLAHGLGENGITTILMEQRGHGESKQRPGRGQVFGLGDFLDHDIPTAIDAVKAKLPNLPLYLGGHSLGGHLSAVTSGRRDDITGVIQLACGFPHHGLYGKRQAGQVKFLCAILPAVTRLLGYFPGDRIGFGGREFRQLMMDWREWALKGTYSISASPQGEEEIARYAGKVLAISFDQDKLATDAAIVFSHSRFKMADVTTRRLTAAEQGDKLGHFDWARAPDGVVKAISSWID
ncbi:MAG: alpha/beta fold hydrolase [Alphaproteobacteria bacterium]|nr:alpha/beta fold hydrolase [Alphaproteobacteria bacterium]